MSRVVHFDIEAEDPERAMEFYGDLFDWEFDSWDGPMDYWLITTGPADVPGIDGGLAKREGPSPDPDTPNPTFTCTIDVDDIQTVVEAIPAHGGEVIRDVEPIPGVGWLAYCTDTEGNRFSVMEEDEEAV